METDNNRLEPPYHIEILPLIIALHRAKWSQHELAERAGLSENTVSVALRQEQASLDTYLKLCAALDVPFCEVILRRMTAGVS